MQKELFVTGHKSLACIDDMHLWGLTGKEVSTSVDYQHFMKRNYTADDFLSMVADNGNIGIDGSNYLYGYILRKKNCNE